MTPPRSFRQRTLALVSSLLVFAGATLQAADSAKKNFDVPPGNAAAALKVFSEQSGEQIVYPVDRMQDISTKAVHGQYTPREALDRMLTGSGLVVVQDEKTGAYAVRPEAQSAAPKRLPTPAEVASAAPLKSPVGPAKTEAGEGIVTLTPFEVNTSKDQGYAATSSLSGTRLNSQIEDLAASLSVITKQQLLDTASVDINDVFLYEVNTEGTKQWTSFSNDRGTISDDIQTNPTGSTRMRGLTAANTAVDGFASSLPFDTYNVDSVEVSRGPNSSIFGLGNSGGGVSINMARANLSGDVTSFGTRVDSYDGYRGNFDFNRVLWKGRLAIRALGLYEKKGFVRKPSSETVRRLQTALTAKPFAKTTLRASFESYRDAYNRPNSTTPRDGITDWIANGRPTYDPIARTVHFADGSSAIGPFATVANETAQLPYGIAPTNTNFTQFPSMYIENGRIQRFEINALPTATGTGPTSTDAAGLHLLTNNTFYNRFSAQYPLYVTKGITDKGIYDWSSINIAAPNYGQQKGETSFVTLEQVILNTPRHKLALQAGWQYERTSDNSRSFLGSYGNAGGKLEVDIDINEKLLDGSPNPYFLRPYLGYPRPGFTKARSAIDGYRSMLAYQLDLTKEESWVKWLGFHSFTGYGEYRSTSSARPGFTDTLSSDETWISANGMAATRNSGSGYRPYVHYLLGDANGANVDYGAPGISAPPYTTTLRYYNGVTQQWVSEPVDFAEYYFANRPSRRLLSTYGGTWQGFFLKGRIIPTFGIRKDSNRTRDADSAIAPTINTDGFYTVQNPPVFNANPWVANRGKTTTEGVVVKPLNWVHLLYNQSNSFTPGSLAYDVNGQPLNDPKGKTRDYGFQFILLGGKLSIRAQQYETVDSGRGDGTVNTYIQRTLRMDGGPNAPTSYPVTSGDPNLSAWYGNELALKNPTWTGDQITAEVIKATGVDPVFISTHYGKTHGDQSQATSRGKELEISFNPNRYWTMRATGAQALAFNGKLSGELQEYIDARMPTWTSIKGPFTGNTWWTTPNGSTTPQTFYTGNVLANIKLLIATQGKQRPQTREYRFNFITNYKLAGLTENRWLKNLDIGGALRWEGRANVGFYGAGPDPDGIVRNYDPNRPIWDKARYYVDLSAGYNARLFGDKVRARLQLNVKDIFEGGRLQAVAYNPDGSPFAFRIVDPRQFIFSVKFDL